MNNFMIGKLEIALARVKIIWFPIQVIAKVKIQIFQVKWSEVKLLSCVWLFATPWTVAHQASPSMEFSRHEYWSGLPFLSPGNLPNPGIEPGSPALQAEALPSEPPGNQWTWVWANSEGQRSLACCSPWDHKESDMTEWLNNKGDLSSSSQ